jgi:hypothetical protein
MTKSSSFTFNLAITVPINPKGVEPVVKADEFWKGLRRGGAKPHLFADYVANTEVLPNPQSELVFRRRLFMAEGAVHTKSGTQVDQDVRLAENLMVGITMHSGKTLPLTVSA